MEDQSGYLGGGEWRFYAMVLLVMVRVFLLLSYMHRTFSLSAGVRRLQFGSGFKLFWKLYHSYS